MQPCATNASPRFWKRLLLFASLWLLAGVITAVFSEGSWEPARDEILDRLRFIFLAPLIAAVGIAFTFVQGEATGIVDADWQQREHIEGVVCWAVLAVFAAHAAWALTAQTRRQFIISSAIQIVFLVVSTPCVIYLFHYEATHGHG